MDDLLNEADASGLSAEADKQYATLQTQIEGIDRQVDAENKMFEDKIRQPVVSDIYGPSAYEKSISGGGGLCGSGSADAGAPEKWVDVNSGQTVLALGKNHKLFDFSTNRGAYSGLSRPEELRGSLGRLVRARILGTWRGAEFEREILALGSTVDNASGGWLVPNPLADFVIDLERAQSVLIQAGARTIPMDSADLRIARIVSDPTVQCKGENDEFTDSGPTFDSIGLTAWTIGCYATFSRELIADASNAAEVNEQSMVGAIATAFDLYGLSGTGSQQPTGIVYSAMPSLNKIPAVGSPSNDDNLDAITAIQVDNAIPNAWIISPTCNNTLAKLLVNTESNHYVAPPDDVTGLQKYVTTSMPDANAVVGDFTKCYIAVRQDMSVEVSVAAGDAFKKHQTAVKVTLRGDRNMSSASAFCVLSGIS